MGFSSIWLLCFVKTLGLPSFRIIENQEISLCVLLLCVYGLGMHRANRDSCYSFPLGQPSFRIIENQEISLCVLLMCVCCSRMHRANWDSCYSFPLHQPPGASIDVSTSNQFAFEKPISSTIIQVQSIESRRHSDLFGTAIPCERLRGPYLIKGNRTTQLKWTSKMHVNFFNHT